MPDFYKARVGDTGWSFHLGDFEITKILDVGFRASSATCSHNTETYDFDGRWRKADRFPTAFHSKPEWTDPPPPKRMKKIVLRRWIGIRWANEFLDIYRTYTLSNEPEDKCRFLGGNWFDLEFEVPDES